MRQGNAGFNRFNESIYVKTIVGIDTHRQIVNIERLICYGRSIATTQETVRRDCLGDTQDTGCNLTKLPKVPCNVSGDNTGM